MPKKTELIGWRYGVLDCQLMDVDPADGQPRFDGLGAPKMVAAKALTFVDVTGEQIVIPLNDEARKAIISGLSGGIEVASRLPEPVH